MARISQNAQDAALDFIRNNANTLHICSAEPADFAGVAGVSLGNKAAPVIGAPEDGAGAVGRRVSVAQIDDGNVTGDGDATHWAIVDTDNNELLATNTLSAQQTVVNGNTFTLAEFDITIGDPA